MKRLVACLGSIAVISLPWMPVWGADDSCMWARNRTCDEPHSCAYGTDYSDCSINPRPETTGANSCEWANDGRCDEPRIGTARCAAWTDTTDCAYGGRTRITDSCAYAGDGQCDEPGFGTGMCASGTDTSDCPRRSSLPPNGKDSATRKAAVDAWQEESRRRNEAKIHALKIEQMRREAEWRARAARNGYAD